MDFRGQKRLPVLYPNGTKIKTMSRLRKGAGPYIPMAKARGLTALSVSLYEQTGQRGKAAQEQALLDLLRRDPHGTARSYRDYQAALARALGGAVSN